MSQYLKQKEHNDKVLLDFCKKHTQTILSIIEKKGFDVEYGQTVLHWQAGILKVVEPRPKHKV